MLWQDTTRVGCALSTSCQYKTYLCQYTPIGNARGHPGLWARQIYPSGTPLSAPSSAAVCNPPNGQPPEVTKPQGTGDGAGDTTTGMPPTQYKKIHYVDDNSKHDEESPPPDPLPAGGAGITGDDARIVLAWTNWYRGLHNAPPLTWDPSLASSAANFAARCPKGHSGTRGLGENMAW